MIGKSGKDMGLLIAEGQSSAVVQRKAYAEGNRRRFDGLKKGRGCRTARTVLDRLSRTKVVLVLQVGKQHPWRGREQHRHAWRGGIKAGPGRETLWGA